MKKSSIIANLVVSCIFLAISLVFLINSPCFGIIFFAIALTFTIIYTVKLSNYNKQENYYQNQMMQGNYNPAPEMNQNYQSPKPEKGNAVFIFITVLCCVSFSCCLFNNLALDKYTDKVEENSSQSEQKTEAKETRTTATKTVTQKTTQAKTTATIENTTEITTTATQPAHRTDEDIIGISNKDLKADNISIEFNSNVADDVTGRWRTAKISDNIDFKEYALSYYNEYFKNDDEVHGIVVSGSMVRINVALKRLYISYLEYTDGEENSAKTLFVGKETEAYCIYLDNGDIEELATWEDIEQDWNNLWNDILGIEEDTKPEEIVIYEDNGFKMIYKGLSKSLSGMNVDLYIENNSGQKATVQCRNFCINDFEINSYFSCDINDGKKANDNIFIFNSTLDDNGLSYNNIEKIEFSFHVFDENFNTIFDSPIIIININN